MGRLFSRDTKVAALTCLVGALVMCPMLGNAQVIRGELQTSKDGPRADIASAVVQLLDSTGQTLVSRTLSDERGIFILHAPAPGHYRITARRIGFRPVTSGLLSITHDTSIVLPMLDRPVSLPAITTVERTECRIRPDSGLAIATLWEDAKTALFAAEITRESSPYNFQLVDHSRVFDFSSGELLAVSLNETNAYDTRSWASVPPEELRRNGYVRFGTDSTAFIAPDIQTLLSSYFADTHCMRIGAHPFAPDSLIGVDFDPATKSDHVEIRGTIWVQRRTHNLTAIDFHYSNLDLGVSDTTAGGHVEFAPLATGGWVLTDWSIRVPVVHVAVDHKLRPTAATSGYRRGMRQQPTMLESHDHIVIDQLRVSGGTLRGVYRDSTPVWVPERRRAEVHVTKGPSRQPVARDEAFAYLVGTRRWLHTDSTGVASFDGLLRGSYLIDVSTKELDVLGWPRERVRVDIGDKRGESAEIQLQSPLAAARVMCADDANSLNESTGVIIGSVKADGKPIADRAVTLSWLEQPDGSELSGAKRVTHTVRTLSGDGRFLMCGVPRNRAVEVHVDGQDASLNRTTRLKHDQVVAIVDMPFDRPAASP